MNLFVLVSTGQYRCESATSVGITPNRGITSFFDRKPRAQPESGPMVRRRCWSGGVETPQTPSRARTINAFCVLTALKWAGGENGAQSHYRTFRGRDGGRNFLLTPFAFSSGRADLNHIPYTATNREPVQRYTGFVAWSHLKLKLTYTRHTPRPHGLLKSKGRAHHEGSQIRICRYWGPHGAILPRAGAPD